MASFTYRGENPFDGVRAAGRKFVGKDESAVACLVDLPDVALSAKVAQFTARPELGKSLVHPGWRADVHPDAATRVFGKVGRVGGESSKALLDQSLPPMAEMVVRKAEERAFLSVKRLPLGRPYVHGGEIEKPPAATLRPGFAFGKPGAKADESAKACMVDEPADPEGLAAAEEVYQKSHRAFPPGMQRKSGVDWALTRADPGATRFGKPSALLERGAVEKCLNPAIEGKVPGAAITQIIPKVVDDFRVRRAHADCLPDVLSCRTPR